jgi:hypothetical protein
VNIGAQSRETVTFELSGLAEGTHRITVAGLSAELKIVQPSPPPARATVDWLPLDLSVIAVLLAATGLLLYLRIRERRTAR